MRLPSAILSQVFAGFAARALALAVVAGSVCSCVELGASSGQRTPSAVGSPLPATATPIPPVTGIAVPGVKARLELSLVLGGDVTGTGSDFRLDDRVPAAQGPQICAEPGRRIAAYLLFTVRGQSLTLTLVVDPVKEGRREALVTVNVVGTSGQQAGGWMTYRGNVTIDPDLLSGSVQAQLSTVPASTSSVTVDGKWRCLRAA